MALGDIPGSREHPVERPGARVLLLDSRDRLLLFRIDDPAVDLRSFRITPGGGLEDGESFEESARRELFEEAGVIECEWGPCVWTRPHVWRWGDRWIASYERYFFARVEAHKVNLDGQLPHERSLLGGVPVMDGCGTRGCARRDLRASRPGLAARAPARWRAAGAANRGR